MHEMIRLDPETVQTPLQEVEEMDIIMAQIPMKALYRLQASVMQEVQSRAHTDATNLEVGRGVTKMLQITCDQLTAEKEEQKYHVDRLEQGVTAAYNRIPNSVQVAEPNTVQNIDHIVQTIDQYQTGDRKPQGKTHPYDSPGGERTKETRSCRTNG
jgi:hypothetical protein